MSIRKRPPTPKPPPKPRPILPLTQVNHSLDPALSRFQQVLPIQRTFNQYDTVSADELNDNIRDAQDFLLSPPRAFVEMLNQDQSIQPYSQTGGILQTVAFDTRTWDTDNMWDSSTASRLYFNTPGLYKLRLYLHFGAYTAPGILQAGIARLSNGLWPYASTGASLTGPKLFEDTRQGVHTSAAGTSCFIEAYYATTAVDDYVEAFASCTHATSTTVQINYANFQARFVAQQ